MPQNFADHFSLIAAKYAHYRPEYPEGLYNWLAKIAPARDFAWDCACGNGQASRGVAEYFAHVIATDASKEQIAASKPHPKIEFRVARAESSGLADRSIDLVTVATALHWFDFEKFYAEVRRVTKPAGVFAAWSYGPLDTPDEFINARLHIFYLKMDSYWPPERRYVQEGYRTIPFPFAEIEAPDFPMTANWSLAELIGYFRTWSSVVRYVKEHGTDPVAELEPDLALLWGDTNASKTVHWPLAVRAGGVNN